ncbi:MAG TPA: fumarylacetoacetate hydrolase family protein [Steroidobacteraceae bacterium]|jgi:2-keto-4-pentenoate hydratase/2-oxohepta-3-ene-1,7-dioic acid hydratase in catechol pathway|nr:fumarylacetoacetate hydrolase family protein [Steroidobacteraceae bacterium]
MKLISFRQGDRTGAGALLTDEVLDFGSAARLTGEQADLSSMLAILRGGASALTACRRLEQQAREQRQRLSAALLPSASLQLLAPIPMPIRNIFCVGRNYLDHVREGASAHSAAVQAPEVPQFFTKATHALIGPDTDVRLDPRITQKLDYEVELAVVIGRGGRDIPASAAFEHVFGYTIANDVTARDLQRRHDQWFKGKSLDSTLPLGPCIVPHADIGDPRSLELSMSVNGEERQRARVEQMIFDIPTLIASLSAGLTLEPGDILSTGTPSGVGFAMKPPCYLRGGDQMVARIDRIGELRNRIVEV